jgi:3-hydroxyacyl-CoA dehydrogenase
VIRKVAVLGAGTMGAQVAAHLAGSGLEVTLLDLAAPSLDTLRKLKPSPLHLPEDLSRIRPASFEEGWKAVADADWVFEVVVEDLEVKRGLLAKVAAAAKKTAIVATNTSGLGIAAMSEGLPAAFRRRFLGMHFFNPPRYLKLLELIPGPETDPAVIAEMEAFADRVLGKGVVRAKDTPNFIGNRIGSFGLGVALREMMAADLTIEDVDALTGPAIGRAKSATFRTADLAGVDVCLKVSENLYQAAAADPQREVFKLPPFVHEMVARRMLGDKTGGGFYRKEDGEIRTLDWKTLEYRERRKAKLPAVDQAMTIVDLGPRIARIMAAKDAAGVFLWRVLSETCFYAATLVGEIADDVASIDRAMEWGYGWGLGPFRLMDAVGVADMAARAQSEGRTVPPLVSALLASGRKRFYEREDGRLTAFGPSGVSPVADRPGILELKAVRERAGAIKKKNAGASLVDLGDGCGLVEFHSKMNALGADAISMLQQSVKDARAHFDALVIGNQGEQFTVGANLMLVLLAVQEEEWDELDRMIRQFQGACMAVKTSEVPVVVAPFGLTLGGGTEISLHGARVRLSAETYMGLVEVGVGLVPAGGGTKEMVLRAHDRCAGVEGADAFPFLKRAFDLIAFAKVSTSGAEARRMFLTPADSISPNPDRLLGDAKELALGLARAGYRPAVLRRDVPVSGRPALATFKMGIHNARRGNVISEHDGLVATKVASILCGGDREPGMADEQHFLDLEREAFLSLLGTRKTRDRIQHMLKEGKPLRN